MWDFDRVASSFGSSEWECLMCFLIEYKFMVCDDSKNVYGFYYYICEFVVEKMLCKFKDFV